MKVRVLLSKGLWAVSLGLLCLAGLTGLGCGARQRAEIPRAHTSDEERAEEKAPVALDIIEAVNDGRRLHVYARVTALTDWDASALQLKLSGLASGRIVHEMTEVVREKGEEGSRILPLGSVRDVYLTIPATDISDYQVELIWGGKGERIKDSMEAKILIREVRVESTGDPGCSAGDCRKPEVAVRFELYNGSERPVERLSIGLSLKRSPGVVDSGAKLSDDYQVIDLEAVSIGPGQSRSVRMVVDAPVDPEKLEPRLWIEKIG